MTPSSKRKKLKAALKGWLKEKLKALLEDYK
jgi:hypothetical protein